MLPARHPQAMMFLPRLALALALAVSTACGGDDAGGNRDGGNGGDDAGGNDAGSVPGSDGGTAQCEPRNGTNLALELTASGFDEPVFASTPPGDSRLFVVERAGIIKIVKDGQVLGAPFLDIDERVSSAPLDNEQGLLGLAFHPNYASNGRFFVYYTAVDSDVESDLPANVVSEFRVMSGSADLADPRSERRVIEVADNFGNHNGGMIGFGRDDGYLYIGLGDGGSQGDPSNNGQDKSTLLGDILRIDINSSAGLDYGIPPSNPYAVPQNGERPEIFISGVRNPWRWSFDRGTGDMYVGDVGGDAREEVTVVPAGEEQSGANLGWRLMEGTLCGAPPCASELIRPVAEYDNPGGRAVVGGYVYRGSCFPDIQGWYFYGDYVTEQVWKFKYAAGTATEHTDVTSDIDPNSELDGLSSFAEDAAGEIYALSIRSGEVFHIVAGP